jgi:hypothetical protein
MSHARPGSKGRAARASAGHKKARRDNQTSRKTMLSFPILEYGRGELLDFSPRGAQAMRPKRSRLTDSNTRPPAHERPASARTRLSPPDRQEAACVLQASAFLSDVTVFRPNCKPWANLVRSLRFGGTRRNACTELRRLITRRSQVQILPPLLQEAPERAPIASAGGNIPATCHRSGAWQRRLRDPVSFGGLRVRRARHFADRGDRRPSRGLPTGAQAPSANVFLVSGRRESGGTRRLWGDEECCGHVTVRLALDNEVGDLEFLRRELFPSHGLTTA